MIRDTGTPELRCSVEAGVATLTLDRPERRNALSDTLTPALRRMLAVLAEDAEVRVLVVTGAGPAFCAGGDLSGMGAGRDAQAQPLSPEAAIDRLRERQETLTLRLAQFPRPTIAALPGPAAGAGFSIALACDLRIMADTAFVTTGFRNVGLPGDYGGSWLLQRLIGPAMAKLLYFTGERVDAARCLQLGIAQQVVPAADLAATTAALAQDIASGPPVAIAHMKRTLDRAQTGDLRATLADEAAATVACAATADHREAVQAFMGKRTPHFQGR
ncbi:MAG TPA: enoyl-CoA hydratase-related protein [Pseudomonadales bacterium]|nr:enoyl-CoA hydratase-related protein [Pseudomonadales bacterium]